MLQGKVVGSAWRQRCSNGAGWGGPLSWSLSSLLPLFALPSTLISSFSCSPLPLCSAACAEADWPRHRGVCRALRLLRAGVAVARPAFPVAEASP